MRRGGWRQYREAAGASSERLNQHPPSVVRTSRPCPQIGIRSYRRTTRFEHDGPIDVLTNPAR